MAPCAITVMSSAISNTTSMSCSMMTMSIDARKLADLADRALGLGRAHAAGRLVEQQQPRRGNQRHADLEQRDVAVGQRAGLALGERGKPDLLERALDLLGGVAIARGRAERMQEAAARHGR